MIRQRPITGSLGRRRTRQRTVHIVINDPDTGALISSETRTVSEHDDWRDWLRTEQQRTFTDDQWLRQEQTRTFNDQ